MRSFAFMLLPALAFVNLALMLPIVAWKQPFEISTVSKGSKESNIMEPQSSQKQAYHVNKPVNSEQISQAASSDNSLRINVELVQRSEQHKKIKTRRIISKRLLAAKGADHSEERLLMVDQVDYASARTHPPTKPPRN